VEQFQSYVAKTVDFHVFLECHSALILEKYMSSVVLVAQIKAEEFLTARYMFYYVHFTKIYIRALDYSATSVINVTLN
jgi:hypothetical protein